MNACVIGQQGERDETMHSAIAVGLMPFAIRPISVEVAEQELDATGLRWAYPLYGVATIAGLRCHAYKTRDNRARISCFIAHANAWMLCACTNEPLLVLESDAVFIRGFDPAEFPDGHGWGMVSLNDPRGATRRATSYHGALQYHENNRGAGKPFTEVPWVDDRDVPQGLPGHSAYVLFPWFAKELIAKAHEVGAMPNDALANKQWFPGKLGCLTHYITKVSGRPSTLA